jgi:hypothetical protein
MLQEFRRQGPDSRAPEGRVGAGVTLCFVCEDALELYRGFVARGLPASRPCVGNGMWVTSLADPDGYRLDFESSTDTPEDTVYSEAAG